MYMVLLVLNDPEMLDDLLRAWEEVGVSGVTVLPSTGMARIREKGAWRDYLPLIPSIEDFHDFVESLNRTIFTVVHSEEMVEAVINASEKITGDLNNPHTGIIVSWQIGRALGLDRYPETKP
jgi:nitrogen regulatory protein PII